ncbi:MAG: hypothetical protein H0T94_04115 [Acidimicrobiia bacterium]|nr:hypothetical protein [Acidimicrobiia bacterium]
MSDIVERARWYVEQKFELSESDVVIRATEDRGSDSWVMELEDPQGTRYVVGYELIDGLLFVRSRREFP